MNLLSLAYTYMKNEMYNSLLILSEYIFCTNDKSEQTAFFILTALQKLNYHESVVKFIDTNTKYMVYKEIQLIYTHSLRYIKNTSEGTSGFNNNTNADQTVSVKHNTLSYNIDSTLLFNKALLENDIVKRDLLLKAFEQENYNLEALIVLNQEKLITKNEFYLLLNIKDKELQDLYTKLFSYDYLLADKNCKIYATYHLCSTYKAIKLALHFLKTNNADLFPLAMFAIDTYPKSYICYFILGLDFYRQANYKEAKKCFYESLQKDKNKGKSWLFLGFVYSKLKECENAIICLTNATKYMIGSYKPILCLAIEHENMNSREDALFYYNLATNKKINKLTLLRKCIFMYKENNSCEMKEIIDLLQQKDLNENEHEIAAILAFFYHITNDNIKDADKILLNIRNTWRQQACLGLSAHFNGNFEQAIEYYNKSMIKNKPSSILESLICCVVTAEKDSFDVNTVIDQANDVFEYCNLDELFIIY